MGSLLSCSVEIKISNNTQNITLRNPKTYLYCGHCPHSSLPELSPGSSGICYFSRSSWGFWGVAGILVYEAESFTLAIHFSNPIDHSTSSMKLGLELSPGKVHLDSLEDTYTRMANGTYSAIDPDIKFDRGFVMVNSIIRSVRVSDGPVKVTATMSDTTNSLLEVRLEEQVEGSPDRKPQSKEKHPGEERTCRIFLETPQDNLELDG